LSMTQVNNWFTNARRRNVTKMRDQKAKNPGAAPPHSPVAAPTPSGLPMSTGVAVALPPAFTVRFEPCQPFRLRLTLHCRARCLV
jgi:hypothetical protein